MARRKKIENNEDDILKKMSELYKDCEEQKKKILSNYSQRKSQLKAEDIEDAEKIGKLENDTFKILNDVIDKKIKVLTLQQKLYTTVYNKSNSNDDEESENVNASLNAHEIKALRDSALSEVQEALKDETKFKFE